MKLCPACQMVLPTSSFGVRRKSWDGLNHKCRSCANKRVPSRMAAARRDLDASGLGWCVGCSSVLPKSDFYVDEAKWTGISSRCRPCARSAAAAAGRLHRTGWTAEEYLDALAAQGGVCAICGQPERVRSRTGKIRALSADHCKETMQKRGILCHFCNSAIGQLDHNPDRLRSAIIYLEKHATLAGASA